MSRHTPGPWLDIPGGHDYRYVIAKDGKGIAKIELPFKTSSAAEQANSRLIAAAPDLLVALENLLDAYSKPDDQICCGGHDCGCMGQLITNRPSITLEKPSPEQKENRREMPIHRRPRCWAYSHRKEWSQVH